MTASGKTTTYTYNSTERLATVSQPGLGSFGFAYDDDSALTTLTRPNGVTSTNSLDAAGRLTGLTYKNSGGTTIAAYAYTLDSAGNRTSATTGGSGIAAGTEHYTLDTVGRLTGGTYADGTTVGFGYDVAGNRTTMTAGGSTTAYTYNAAEESLQTPRRQPSPRHAATTPPDAWPESAVPRQESWAL